MDIFDFDGSMLDIDGDMSNYESGSHDPEFDVNDYVLNNTPDSLYNVSFGAQKESLQRSGGGLGSLDVTITKEPGSSNLFCITDGRHTIHDVPGSTKTIEISGITYKLPKLKG